MLFSSAGLPEIRELRYTPNGTAGCRFTLAEQRKHNREEADFIDIVAWRGLAENCATYLSKGKLTAVEGRLQVGSYEGQTPKDAEWLK